VNTFPMASTLLNIGDFSRMTHLSVKALRHYHDVGILEPAAIDPHSGYRSYDAGQVTSAQVIRRLRDLGMSLDSIRAVLTAPDVAARNREIAAHLERMERQLEQTQAAVSGLRALLGGPAPRPEILFRTIPAVTALAVVQTVTTADIMTWADEVISELSSVLRASGLAQAGPLGALFPGEFFQVERSEITVFVPIGPLARAPRLEAGRVRLTEIAGIEAAVAVHEGPPEDIDRTYGALGTAVAERAIGVDGPIREYYPDGFDALAPHRDLLAGLPDRRGRPVRTQQPALRTDAASCTRPARSPARSGCGVPRVPAHALPGANLRASRFRGTSARLPRAGSGRGWCRRRAWARRPGPRARAPRRSASRVRAAARPARPAASTARSHRASA
jgi:DNA-binding transcriptional MerR regulator